jgi:hypothetical protein
LAPETVTPQPLPLINQEALVRQETLVRPPALHQVQPAAAAPPKAQLQAELAKKYDERARQDVTTEAKDRLYDAAGKPQPSAQGANSAAAANGNTSVVNYNPPLESRAGSVASFGELRGAASAGMAAAVPVHLPSGLAATSTASSGRRMLAIDKAGTLFLSDDARGPWQRVAAQWTGRAMLVRTKTEPVPNAAVAGAIAGNGNSTVTASAAPAPSTVFEIVNDKDQVWMSTDGVVWYPNQKPADQDQ